MRIFIYCLFNDAVTIFRLGSIITRVKCSFVDMDETRIKIVLRAIEFSDLCIMEAQYTRIICILFNYLEHLYFDL
jgi:hypothetical protein